ncbi:lipase 3-like [Coccinella septempunctata]|uniref:lipase 3-like n=1 Tax=Coccinella septempunctata TaxID=41139 RepID=UPI001D062A4E|nr:lipase 3-like [Coccinella septempunctata]
MWNYEKDYRERITNYLEDLVKKDGYHLEKYSVITRDGYINVMYRIPYGKYEEQNSSSRPSVLLNHGLICSCAIFIDQCALAYYLADNGFDVWLPNNRGTTFSTKHVDYDADEEKDRYWDFSFHEIAIYDLTAFIDFILEQNGEKQICHIGFSQGVTTFAIMTSEIPEYNEKISLSIFLGTPLVFDNVSSFPVKFNGYLLKVVIMIMEMLSRKKFNEMPLVKEVRFSLSYGKNIICRKLIEYFMSYVVGYGDPNQISDLDFTRFGLTTPNSSSKRQFEHFSQLLINSRFAKYDFGAEENMKQYGSKLPPEYDLSKVTAPIAIFYGKNDMYNDYKKDKLETLLLNVVHMQVVDYEFYNHIDFIYAKDNIDLLYKYVLKQMKKYCLYNGNESEIIND